MVVLGWKWYRSLFESQGWYWWLANSFRHSEKKLLNSHKSLLRVVVHDWTNWFGPVFTDLSILLLVPLSVESMSPKGTWVWVCLIVALTVRTFEWMRTWFAFFCFKAREFVFELALQHQPNSRWFSDLWGLLHLTHLAPWILHENVEWPQVQQFLHCRTPGFMLAPLTVAMNLPMLKHQLIRDLALLLLWTSLLWLKAKS